MSNISDIDKHNSILLVFVVVVFLAIILLSRNKTGDSPCYCVKGVWYKTVDDQIVNQKDIDI